MSEERINYVGDTGGDSQLNVMFYKGFIDGIETDFIKISIPGDSTLTIDVEASDYYKARFRTQFEAYLGYRNLSGTPIDDWTEIPEGLKNELRYQSFKFVEQLANAPDSALNKMMGGTQLRDKARAFLDRGKVDSDVVIQKQSEQIAELTDKVNILMNALNGSKPKKRAKSNTAELNDDEIFPDTEETSVVTE